MESDFGIGRTKGRHRSINWCINLIPETTSQFLNYILHFSHLLLRGCTRGRLDLLEEGQRPGPGAAHPGVGGRRRPPGVRSLGMEQPMVSGDGVDRKIAGGAAGCRLLDYQFRGIRRPRTPLGSRYSVPSRHSHVQTPDVAETLGRFAPHLQQRWPQKWGQTPFEPNPVSGLNRGLTPLLLASQRRDDPRQSQSALAVLNVGAGHQIGRHLCRPPGHTAHAATVAPRARQVSPPTPQTPCPTSRTAGVLAGKVTPSPSHVRMS